MAKGDVVIKLTAMQMATIIEGALDRFVSSDSGAAFEEAVDATIKELVTEALGTTAMRKLLKEEVDAYVLNVVKEERTSRFDFTMRDVVQSGFNEVLRDYLTEVAKQLVNERLGITAPQKKPADVWDDNEVQFARLLTEIQAVQCCLNYETLAASMDLQIRHIQELFDRANRVFKAAKSRLCPPVPPDTGHETED